MLKLVEETSENVKITSSTHEECFDEEDCIPGTPECHSPLPPGARNVIEKMNDIYEDVFSDDGHETSKIIKLTNENMNPNIPSPTSVARNDPFMVVYQNASSPALLPSENQHGVVSLNISSALTPLNTSTLVSDLSPFPQPITPAIDNNGQTPMLSPATHGEVCNDFSAPSPDDANYRNCPSNNTAVSSCQYSPVTLIRCRSKKRVRNYGHWKEVKRKRLTNAGKEYSSKKGVIVPAKSIGKPCTCRSDDLREQYAKHLSSKKQTRTLEENDKNDAINSDGRFVCATFDFQNVLSCPRGQMSILYYKRKLSCYNFTIYDMADKQGYCYMWYESVAKRGANEVASCVYDFIKKFVSKGVKEFRFWSDNCAGQNRNRIVFGMYAHVTKEYNINVTHIFLEKGHTQNEGDSVHSVIERTAEHKTIYTPDEWKLLVRWAKVSGDSYEVIDVNQALVFDFKDQLKNKNWVKNTANNKVTWTGIKEVSVDGTQSNKIQHKYALSDDYMTLILRKETRNYNTPTLHKAYVGSIPISKDKYKDLTSLCDSLIIPAKYHYFFRNLIHGHNVSDDNNESD